MTASSRTYPAILCRKSQQNPAKTKGQRTKARLEAATAEVLNPMSYHAMRISDICAAAGTSNATFYQYYDNKEEITLTVLRAFCDWIFEDLRRPPETVQRDDFSAIYDANLRWLTTVRANMGLMRRVLQVSDENGAFSSYYRRRNHDYYVAIAKGLLRRTEWGEDFHEPAILCAYAFGSLTDDFTRKLLDDSGTELQGLVERNLPTDEALANFLSTLWYKAMFTRSDGGMLRAAFDQKPQETGLISETRKPERRSPAPTGR